MSTILPQAQALVSTLKALMPSIYQQDSLQALLGLFLEGQGIPLPEHCKIKSASASRRFLNEYKWPTRQVIRTVLIAVIRQILSLSQVGRRPTLQVILDLTTLEKAGKFKEFKHLIRVYNGKRGLHVVLLYIVVGQWRVPWAFQVYRGRDTPSPAQLGLRLLRRLPKILTQHFEVLVLADTAFGSNEFVTRVRQLKHNALVGVTFSPDKAGHPLPTQTICDATPTTQRGCPALSRKDPGADDSHDSQLCTKRKFCLSAPFFSCFES